MNIQSNEVVMENLNKQVNNYLTTWGFFFPVFSCCTQGGVISHMRIWLNMATKILFYFLNHHFIGKIWGDF